MKIKTRCEHCGQVYQTDENFLGRTAQCRNCRKRFTMTPFEDQPAAPGPQEGLGRIPAPGQPQAPPAQGQDTPGQGPADTQVLVCPKCKFTADIPRVNSKLKLRCQECGHGFVVRPDPQNRPGHPLPTEKAPGEHGSKATALLLSLLLLATAVLLAGPRFFPEIFRDLGLPNLLKMLPY